jgi:N-acetylmuramoyl-L-alanine amidase
VAVPRGVSQRSAGDVLAVAVAGALVCVLSAQADAAVTLRAVRSVTAPDTTRLIVEFSAPVQHSLQRVAARPDLGVPARVYVDLFDARLADGLHMPAAFSEGPLQRLRATQSAATTRLILDVPGLAEFGTFAIPDPFRLIIDVRGTARAAAVHPVAPRISEAPAPTPGRAASPVPALAVARPAGRATAPRAPSQAVPRRFKIVLDPGHGGKDPGAFGAGGVAEKDVVLAIAHRLKEQLIATPGIDVVLTRDTDVFLALEERTARANAEHADLFVSIHANASPNPSLSGVETYYLNNTKDRATLRLAEMENGLSSMTGHRRRDRDASFILSDLIQNYKIQESVALAEQVQRALVSGLGSQGGPVNNLGVKRGPFYVLVGAGMPCVLVEVSFLTNPQEAERLAQPAYQAAIAEGLLRGIRRFVENREVAENL